MKTSRKFAVTGVFLLGASYVLELSKTLNLLTFFRSLGASIVRMVLQIQLSIYGYTTKTDIFRKPAQACYDMMLRVFW